MPEPDAILLLGLVVAREMGWAIPPAFKASVDHQKKLGSSVTLAADGAIV
jgi:hypothetical protein